MTVFDFNFDEANYEDDDVDADSDFDDEEPVQHPILPTPSCQRIAGTNSIVLKPHAM